MPKVQKRYVGSDKIRPSAPKIITETITLAATTSSWSKWYSNIQKSWYKIISIQEVWSISNQNTWEDAYLGYYNATSSSTYGVSSYLRLWSNVSSYNTCWTSNIQINWTWTTVINFWTPFGWYWTANFTYTRTEDWVTVNYNWTTYTYTRTSAQKTWIQTFFAWAVYPCKRNYSQSRFWQSTVTITYQKV